MRLFLDSSVVLAACGRSTGASRALFDLCDKQGWTLQTSPYVLSEVGANLPKLPPGAIRDWSLLRRKLREVPDVFSIPWPNVFEPAKDRPILFTASAWSDLLLSLDRGDFGGLLGSEFYGLLVMRPGDFLRRERSARRLP